MEQGPSVSFPPKAREVSPIWKRRKVLIKGHRNFQLSKLWFGLYRGTDALHSVLSVNYLCDPIPNWDSNCPIIDLQVPFLVYPIKNNAVWIIAPVDGELLDAVNPPRVENPLHGALLCVSVANRCVANLDQVPGTKHR